MTTLLDLLQQQPDRIVNTQSGEIVARYPLAPLTLNGDLTKLTFPVFVYPDPGGYMGVTGHDIMNDTIVIATQTALEGEQVDEFRQLLLAQLDYQSGDEQPQIASVPEEVFSIPRPVAPEGEEDTWSDEARIGYQEAMAEYERQMSEKLDASAATMATNKYSQFVDFLADLEASLLFRVVDGKLTLSGGIKRATGEPYNPAGIKEIAQQYTLPLTHLGGFQTFADEATFATWLESKSGDVVIKDAQGAVWKA